MNIITFLVLRTSKLRLDLEGMSTEVITLSLKEIGREILGTVTVKPGQGGGEGRGGYTEKCGLGNDISPAGLGLVDCCVEEVVEEQIFKVVVGSVGGRDVFEEDGADNAASTPHEGDGWLIELPAIFLGSLEHIRYVHKQFQCRNVPLA